MIICLSRSGAGHYPSPRLAAGRHRGWAAADTRYDRDGSASVSLPTPPPRCPPRCWRGERDVRAMTPFALGVIAAVLSVAIDQAQKLYCLNILEMVEGQHFALTPFLDIFLAWNRGHLLQPVPAAHRARPLGALCLQDRRCRAAGDLALASLYSPHRPCHRARHRRRARQCDRSSGLWCGRRLLLFPCRRFQLVRLQPCRLRDCCRRSTFII